MASKSEPGEVKAEPQGLVAHVRQNALIPIRLASSKTAQHAYLTIFLAISTACVLLGFATVAYLLFYWNYIPRIGFERTIHLQFDHVLPTSESRHDTTSYPWGLVTVTPDVVSDQGYDIKVELILPRTRMNRDAGNFMVEGALFASGSVLDTVKETLVAGVAGEDNRLATSRRPAILQYRSQPVEYLWRLLQLHWYLLGFRNESEKVAIPLWESVSFAKGWRNTPSTMQVQVQSIYPMQIASAKAIFRARFTGLRWLMYNHRIGSAIVFILIFWATEVVFAGLTWTTMSFYLSSPTGPSPRSRAESEAGHQAVKAEPDDDDNKALLSDTERTFPTLGNQLPLRYRRPEVKNEDETPMPAAESALVNAAEADDEIDEDDEDADVFLDSGIGTSMESSSSRRRDIIRRRKAKRSSDGASD